MKKEETNKKEILILLLAALILFISMGILRLLELFYGWDIPWESLYA